MTESREERNARIRAGKLALAKQTEEISSPPLSQGYPEPDIGGSPQVTPEVVASATLRQEDEKAESPKGFFPTIRKVFARIIGLNKQTK